MRRSCCFAFVCLLSSLGPLQAAEDDKEGIELFEKKIRQVLVERCFECHSAKAKKVEGNLLLDSRDTSRKGGDLGPAIVPGDLDKSLLIQAIRYADENLQMPPKEKGRLPAEIVADFEAWVKRGAPDPRDSVTAAAYTVDIEAAKKRWPYTPPVEPAIPRVQNAAWPRNPIDQFILAKLEEKGLAPAADADPRTLLRRVTYDLIGLPPSAEELDEYLSLSPSPPLPLSPSSSKERESGRGGEGESGRSIGPPPSSDCSPRRTTASAGAGIGSTWSVMPTRPATTATTRSPRCIVIAIG